MEGKNLDTLSGLNVDLVFEELQERRMKVADERGSRRIEPRLVGTAQTG